MPPTGKDGKLHRLNRTQTHSISFSSGDATKSFSGRPKPQTVLNPVYVCMCTYYDFPCPYTPMIKFMASPRSISIASITALALRGHY